MHYNQQVDKEINYELLSPRSDITLNDDENIDKDYL